MTGSDSPASSPAREGGKAGRVLRFACVGTIGFLADAGGLALLIAAGFHPIPARLVSIAAALYVTWRLNRRLTFRTQAAPSLREFAQYASVGAVSSGLNYLVYVMLLASGLIGNPLVATAAGSAVAMSFTFWGLDRWVFGPGGLRRGAKPRTPRSTRH